MKRASTPQKKEEQPTSILERARAYIATKSFEEIRLVDLACELDLVKGTPLPNRICLPPFSWRTWREVEDFHGEAADTVPRNGSHAGARRAQPPSQASCKPPHDHRLEPGGPSASEKLVS